MKELKITALVREYTYDELPDDDKKLIDAAKDATARSLATYSHFHVGAALLLENGEIVTGANQENAAYPSGTCAERTAAYYASSRYPGVAMKKLAVAAWTRLHHPDSDPDDICFQAAPISPCGACRQALLEYESLHGPIEVFLYGLDRIYRFASVSDLIPYNFTQF